MAIAKKHLKGFDKVLRNLDKAVKTIERRTMKGLIRGQIIVRRDMKQTPPLIPKDTGHLEGSYETKPYYKGRNPVVIMAFTASYAWYVHEMVGANFSGKTEKLKYTKSGKVTAATKKYSRREGAGAKFLEASIDRNTAKVLAVIREEVMIKP